MTRYGLFHDQFHVAQSVWLKAFAFRQFGVGGP